MGSTGIIRSQSRCIIVTAVIAQRLILCIVRGLTGDRIWIPRFGWVTTLRTRTRMMGIFTRGGTKSRGYLTLTKLGKQKAEAFAGMGPIFTVLVSISENNSTVTEISHDTGLDPDRVRETARSLIKQGFVAVER